MDFASVQSSLLRYEDAFRAKIGSKKPKVAAELVKIDRWLRKELPATVAARQPPSLTHQELSDLMKWKLGRGKFRPRLQQLAESNAPELVVNASEAAFTKLDGGFKNLKAALDELCVLKGVGPATASLLLSVYAPDLAPFMSDEAVQATASSMAKIDYTTPRYLQYANEIKTLRIQLNKGVAKGSLLSAVDVERALWISAVLGKEEIDGTKEVELQECPVIDDGTPREKGDENEPVSKRKAEEKSHGKRKSSPLMTKNNSSRSKKSRR